MVTFWIVFGLFLAAISVWAVLTVRWSIRRNRELKMSQSPAELSE